MYLVKDELGRIWGHGTDFALAQALAMHLFQAGHTPEVLTADGPEEYRCGCCLISDVCPAAYTGVCYPCPDYCVRGKRL